MSRRPAQPLLDGMRFPGHGMPERETDSVESLSPWARLSRGQSLGSKVNINYSAAADGPQASQNAIFELRGEHRDLDACQLSVTLLSPSVIPNEVANIGIDIAGATGELDAANVGAENFPGTVAPIAWPPIVACIRWGVGGARATALVDFVNGTVVNVPASALDVWAIVPPDAVNAPGTSGIYTLSAFVSPGVPRPGNAQRTVFVGELELAEESDIFVVPAFAKRVTVIGCDPVTTPGVAPAVTVAYLRFWQSPDGTNNVGNFLVSGNVPASFNVPNGGMYFSVVSGMSTDAPFAAIFDLTI